jgi:MFS family permease
LTGRFGCTISYPWFFLSLATDRLGYGKFQQQILVAAGLCFAADSMEVMLLSFLSIVLLGEWNLSGAQAASLTTFVFLGALGGTLTLGPLGDHIGRKPVFTITAFIIAIFGFATALANSYWTLVVLRFFVGFGVGGLTVPFDTLAELIPQSSRGANLLLVEYFWTAGTLLTPVAAFLTIGTMTNPTTSWRWFVVLCALPCVASTIIGYRVVPESPRWLLVQGKHDTALDILRQAAGKNGMHPLEVFPAGTTLRADDHAHHHRRGHPPHHAHFHDGCDGHSSEELCDEDDDDDPQPESVWESLQELFSPLWKRTTLFLWLSWAGLAICYYGTVLVSTAVFATAHDDPQDQTSESSSSSSYSFDYGAVLASASAEIAGTTMVLFTIDRMGRVVSQSVAYAAGGVSVFVLCWLASTGTSSRTSLVLAAFTARLFFMGATCTTWVSTAEIFPTHLRTTGHASCNAVARIGGAISPLLLVGAVGPAKDSASFLSSGVVLLVVSLLTAWSTWNLPETAGRGMGRAVVAAMRQSDEGVFRCGPDQELPRSHAPRDGSVADALPLPSARRPRTSLAESPSLS